MTVNFFISRGNVIATTGEKEDIVYADLGNNIFVHYEFVHVDF